MRTKVRMCESEGEGESEANEDPDSSMGSGNNSNWDPESCLTGTRSSENATRARMSAVKDCKALVYWRQ